MSRVYDNWERLVAATIKREEIWQLCHAHSRDSSFCSISSDFTSASPLHDTFPNAGTSVVVSGIPGEISDSSVPSSANIPSGSGANSVESTCVPRPEAETSLPPETVLFSFKELKRATGNFRTDRLLGDGAFGPVFKGWIDEHSLNATKPGSGMAVAVKKLNPEGFFGHKEWLTEVNYLSHLHHPNLVKLIGCCLDGDNRLLIYEFMQKGSLANHLFRRVPLPLSWAIRIKVAIGAAGALSFLHNAEQPVIHRDIAASNILLDGEYNAKLSGFALAKDGPPGDTHVTTRVMGTSGYAAPEYVATGRLTTKCDVYNFGVVLLELICGRCIIDKSRNGTEQNLVDWAKLCLGDKRKLFRLMDTKLEGQYPKRAAYTVATLALQCLIPDPELRPRMAEVLATLEQIPTQIKLKN